MCFFRFKPPAVPFRTFVSAPSPSPRIASPPATAWMLPLLRHERALSRSRHLTWMPYPLLALPAILDVRGCTATLAPPIAPPIFAPLEPLHSFPLRMRMNIFRTTEQFPPQRCHHRLLADLFRLLPSTASPLPLPGFLFATSTEAPLLFNTYLVLASIPHPS
jgi:hypothetical protein